MVTVTVKYFASTKEITGKREEILEIDDGMTVESLLQILSKGYGPRFTEYLFDERTGALRDNVRILVDGKSTTSLQGGKTKITEGCQIAMIPPVGGG